MKILNTTVFLLLVLLMPACHDDGEVHYRVVYVMEDILYPTTWVGNTVYVIVKYDFYVQDVLTIEPGAIIKFHPADGPYLMMYGAGKVIAHGTSSRPVVFTSFRDDFHGGDQNEDGMNSEPAAEDWGELNTNGTSGSSFRYCEFWYGGAVYFGATLTIYGNDTEISHCKFISNGGRYDHKGVLDASDAGTGVIIEQNVFYNNQRPLSISSFIDLDDSNLFHNPDKPEETNRYNGIFVNLAVHIMKSQQWYETEVPFVIDGYQRCIDEGGVLTLGNNVVVKFCNSGELLLTTGARQLINRDGPGVYFTSYKDDSKKGDTNGDGTASSPDDGDWSGIYDNSLAIPFPYFFTWDNILFDSY